MATTAAAAFRAARPVSDAMWLERVSRLAADLPPEWRREPVLELERIEALRSPCGRLGPADGVLRPGEPFPVVPGTDPERPISASALQQLLQCPRMFLMRRILHWDEPAEAPPLRELDAASFGTLVHQVVEAFYREHGESFVAGERSLAHWQKRASELADRELDAFLSEYPLVGAGVRTKERDRLQESVRAFLEYDWGTPGRRYVGVELPFGTQEEPLAITADGITLHVTGFIDRVDVEGGATLVRDLKSGKAHPRAGKEKDPTPIRDVQLGLYQLAATKLASRWGTPRRVEVAYAYASGRVEVQERAFRGGDAPVLAKATKAWLETAAHLLTARAFPATPHEEDCEFCPFEPLCGERRPAPCARGAGRGGRRRARTLPRARARGRGGGAMTLRERAPDQDQRDAAIGARGVNVIADAGAGTGKTTLLVARLVELVAPGDDGAALALERVAAITFTRKAAGELKLRIREALLRELARADLTNVRRRRLADALAVLDTAHVGTIHSFSDRLLRLRPVEARLSPSYDIVEDESELLAETFAVLLHAVEAGTLASELAGAVDAKDAEAAQATFVDALRAGLRAERRVHAYGVIPGLDCLIEELVRTRDVKPVVPAARKPDLARFGELVDEYVRHAKGSRGAGAGSRYLAATRKRLERVRDEVDPVRILRELLWCAPPPYQKGKDFPEDDIGWALYKALAGDDGKKRLRDGALHEDLLRPFARWMGRRLVATAPVVVAMYEKVKARHRAVDQVDLLLRLRDLLHENLAIREEYQALFDHVLVDEFQDTDPLQAEIVLYLCERGARAIDWPDVALVPGKLTIVGDPKQSIYRFRRADISVYAAVREIVERGPHLVAKLSANFRCEPRLLDWLNGRFDDLLGTRGDGEAAFDPDAGTVANDRLLAGRKGGAPTCVQVLPLVAEGGRKPAFRATEAKALAAYLRRLVEGQKRAVVDPTTGATRPVRYGDVAVLVPVTTNVPLLFPELDRQGVPYAARGGSLFLGDPLHRQFLLGLRALADRDDGVAQAALLRSPFFALDYDDLARERVAEGASTHPGVLRARAALELVGDLRRRRLERSPGTTARELLERTAFARAVALGPNGAQRLEALHELCLALDTVAAGGLDFDAATARLRAWATDPVSLDPPRPVASEAVQILSIHQAKGLEFPVVVLWDACAELAARDDRKAFVVDRSGDSWALALDGLEWQEPEDGDLAGRERRYLDAERRRLVYVAATRARDLLVLPVAGAPRATWITGRLVAGAPAELMETLDPYGIGAEPPWASELPPLVARPRGDASTLAAEIARGWQAALDESRRPRFSPAAVSAEAHAAIEELERPGEAGPPPPERKSRYGRLFGDTVHHAIGLALRDPALAPGAAVARAAVGVGLDDHLAEATEDVVRALAALDERRTALRARSDTPPRVPGRTVARGAAARRVRGPPRGERARPRGPGLQDRRAADGRPGIDASRVRRAGAELRAHPGGAGPRGCGDGPGRPAVHRGAGDPLGGPLRSIRTRRPGRGAHSTPTRPPLPRHSTPHQRFERLRASVRPAPLVTRRLGG